MFLQHLRHLQQQQIKIANRQYTCCSISYVDVYIDVDVDVDVDVVVDGDVDVDVDDDVVDIIVVGVVVVIQMSCYRKQERPSVPDVAADVFVAVVNVVVEVVNVINVAVVLQMSCYSKKGRHGYC